MGSMITANYDSETDQIIDASPRLNNGVANFSVPVTASPSDQEIRLSVPLVGRSKLVATAGDSIFADGFVTVVNAGYTSKTFTQWGTLAWLRRLLGSGISISFDRQFATSGHTINQILTIQIPWVVASGASRLIMDGGINSVTNGVSFDAMTTDLQSIFDTCSAAGIYIDYVALRACANGNITDAQARVADRLNRWISAYAASHPRSMQFHDWNSVYMDLATGYAKTAYLRDGKHDNSVSAVAAATWLAPRLGTQELPILGGVGDTYSATDNPNGNCATNPKQTGTGGNKSNGATGSVPDSYSVYRTNASSTATLATSIEADDVYVGINRTVLTFGGTADSMIAQWQQTQSIPGNFAVGDRVRAQVMLDVNIPAGYLDLALYLGARDGSYVKYGGEAWDGVWVATNGTLPAINATNLVYVTEPFVIGNGATTLDMFVRVQTPASGALTGTVKIKALDIRKV